MSIEMFGQWTYDQGWNNWNDIYLCQDHMCTCTPFIQFLIMCIACLSQRGLHVLQNFKDTMAQSVLRYTTESMNMGTGLKE